MDRLNFLRALAREKVAVLGIRLAKLLFGLAPSGSLVFLLEREQWFAGFYFGTARHMEARELPCDGRSNAQVLSLRVALQCAVGRVAAARDSSQQNDMKALHPTAPPGVGVRSPSRIRAR